ncbi:MAG TPA: hypothetical protein VKR06_01965 [Ktedonosporobacter sp.]|nr:hypothetical protein [Ktedonosporobacter sp.]
MSSPTEDQTKSSRLLARLVADKLQSLYEANRICETWGSPSVSQPTFTVMRERGFWRAYCYLLQRLQETGHPSLSPATKLTALVGGVTMVTIANRFLRAERKPATMVHATRTFSRSAPLIPVALYTVGATLLVAASNGGGGGSDDGDDGGDDGGRRPDYPGSETSVDYRGYEQPDKGDGERKASVRELDYFDIRDMGWRKDDN